MIDREWERQVEQMYNPEQRQEAPAVQPIREVLRAKLRPGNPVTLLVFLLLAANLVAVTLLIIFLLMLLLRI